MWNDNDRLERCFITFDHNNKGYLNEDDFEVAIYSIFGFDITEYEMNKYINESKLKQQLNFFNNNNNNNNNNNIDGLMMDLNTFKDIIKRKLTFLSQPLDTEIHSLFKSFDINSKGFITQNDLILIFQEILPSWKRDRVIELFNEVDFSGTGRITYQQFTWIMSESIPSYVF